MPSKRTNDSVDRILADLNQRQAADGVRASVTDHQVDEILRSVGISTTPLQSTPTQDSQIAFSDFGGPDDFEELMRATAPAAPSAAPRRTAEAPLRPAVAPASAPVQQRPAQVPQAAQPAQPVQPVRQPAAPVQGDPTLQDTTRTGIIKDFLRKMAPDGDVSDTGALNEGKADFQRFFADSVAVVPDEKGRLRDPGKKKRGFFGLKSADDTDHFEPINVSLGSGHSSEPAAHTPAQPVQAEEFFPDEAEAAQTPAPRPARKHGFFNSLFGGDDGYADATDELMIPEERQDEPTLAPLPSAPRPAQETGSGFWRSKYTRPQPEHTGNTLIGETLTGDTLMMLRSVVSEQKDQKEQAPVKEPGATSTIYRKKRSTVEFTPGQKRSTPPPAPPAPPQGPVGEPLVLPGEQPAQAIQPGQTTTGFTMQLNSPVLTPSDSTQQFINAYNAVRPRPAQPQPAPVQSAAVPQAPVKNTQPAAPVEEPTLMADSYHHTRDAVDDLVDTLTGRIRLAPVAPDAAAQPAQAQPFQPAPQPQHTGFTQDLGIYAAAPAHTGFTQSLGQAPAEPATGSFVDNIANAINTGAISDETARYDEMAARLTSNLEAEAGEQGAQAGLRDKLHLGGFHLGGKAGDENPDVAAQPFDTAEIPVSPRRDYESAEDAPAVRNELDKNLLQLTTACIVSGVAALVLLVLAFIAAALPAMPGVLAGETVYPAVALVLLAVAGGINWKTILNGLQGLAKKPTPDSLTALAVVGALLQCLVVLISRTYTHEVTLLAGPAALVLCANAIGKRISAATVRDNFQLVSKNVDHAVAYRLKDAGALRAASQGLAQPHPSVLVSRPTQIFRGFLASSAAAGTSDKNQQQFAWAASGCALLGFVITIIRTHSLTSSFTILASILCLAAPLAGTLLSALPARLMQRSAAQVGAVVPGWRDIRQLGRINVIQVTARDLFPQGCVTLAGIKPIKNAPIDLAIVYAASIMAEACPTLRDVFLNMLGDRSLLAKVDDRQTVYGKGYIGWINKRRVLVGNRSLMQDYGVKLPSLEYEQHHTVNQRRMIYLAVSGKLFAMFQVAYQRDPDTAAVLDSLRHSGLSLIVDCDDFNCDTALLEAAYSLPAGAVKVLNTTEHELMNPATAWLPESDGNMLHLGSFASFVGGLEAAAGAAEGERKSAVVVTASVLISCALGVLLTLTGGLATLPLPALVLYQAAWCVLAMIFPLFQRY